jgi:hypothetical protein
MKLLVQERVKTLSAQNTPALGGGDIARIFDNLGQTLIAVNRAVRAAYRVPPDSLRAGAKEPLVLADGPLFQSGGDRERLERGTRLKRRADGAVASPGLSHHLHCQKPRAGR